MTLKKTIIIFLIVYITIGILAFVPSLIKKDHSEVIKKSGMKVELEWDVHNELNGNYRTPAWLKNNDLMKYVEEVEYTGEDVGGPALTSAYQLMSLFAQLQLGDPTITSSFINPDISYTDYESHRVHDIINTATSLANEITKDKSLIKVKVSSPIPGKDNEVTHTVILQYRNGEEIEISNIPMILIRSEENHEDNDEEGMWYMNINLQELAQRVKKTEGS